MIPEKVTRTSIQFPRYATASFEEPGPNGIRPITIHQTFSTRKEAVEAKADLDRWPHWRDKRIEIVDLGEVAFKADYHRDDLANYLENLKEEVP